MDFINTCFETTGDVRSLALYSHLLPVVIGIILSYFILANSKARTESRLFVLFTTLLSLWLIGDLVTWHSDNYYYVAAFWSTLDYINILFYLAILAFFYVQTQQVKVLPGLLFFVLLLVSLAPFLVTLSGLAVFEFDEPNCEMIGNELLASYKLYTELISVGFILILGVISAIKNWAQGRIRNRILTLTFATTLFLLLFSGSEYIATLTNVYEITLYALFALPLFLLVITFSIIEQEALRIQADTFTLAKLLFAVFIIVAGFNLVLVDDALEFWITLSSVIVTTGFGLLLLRSARREQKQRLEIEKLATNLEHANERLRILDKQKSEFVSIASHQLRSPLTAIRGYVSLIEEGSFGEVPEKMKDALHRISESGKFMAVSIDDFLNVSRIESGNMKYEYKDINLREQTEHIVEDLRADATKRGLLLLFKTDLHGKGIVHADFGKTQQILHNLINNALKYTRQGSVTVFVHDDPVKKVINVEFIDTGIGMSTETLEKLFGKFARAKIASSANIMGTGLGLFVARSMARAMKGDVTAHSEGEGKGSRFVLTLPYVM